MRRDPKYPCRCCRRSSSVIWSITCAHVDASSTAGQPSSRRWRDFRACPRSADDSKKAPKPGETTVPARSLEYMRTFAGLLGLTAEKESRELTRASCLLARNGAGTTKAPRGAAPIWIATPACARQTHGSVQIRPFSAANSTSCLQRRLKLSVIHTCSEHP